MSENSSEYESGSLSLLATVAMGTGVMIGAGIFALTGQVAELAGGLFPVAFIVAAVVSGFSAYSYIKVSSRYPSAGGIAMILKKAYGESTVTGAAALLMALSMIINESLVARTFAAYTMRLFPSVEGGLWVPGLAVGLIAVTLLVNLTGNRIVGAVSNVSAVLKIGGLLVFAGIAVAASGLSLQIEIAPPSASSAGWDFVGGVALAVLAFKGFTTITNSGGEVVDPKRNVGRAIVIALAICLLVYMAVSYAVSSSLSLEQLIVAKDYSLAEAARPALGGYGQTCTIVLAVFATSSGWLARSSAVSRMLAMLTEMNLIPHSHFGMPGSIQQHLLVYTVVVAATLAALFDLSRIAAMGAVLYLVMDITLHWGVLRALRDDVDASAPVVVCAIALDAAVLGALLVVKGRDAPLIVGVSVGCILVVAGLERLYLRELRTSGDTGDGSG